MSGSAQVQLDLFGHVAAAYAAAPEGVLDNASLYKQVAERAGMDLAELDARVPIGTAGTLRSPAKRRIRWFQQSLKQIGVIERVEGERGIWRLADPVDKKLHRAAAGVKLIAFSTELGVAIWGSNKDVFPFFSEEVALYISSPPYPLRQARAYGNPDQAAHVDFVCRSIEPILRNLVQGGSVVLNLGNEIFEPGLPARSVYIERLVLALHERLGLALMDRIPWINLSKPPGPTYWACRTNVPQARVQLSAAYEHIFWFTNDPSKVRSDNRRVLETHTARHLRLMAAGGANRSAIYGDGVYRINPDSFSNITDGSIPRNVIQRGHVCRDTNAYREHCRQLGIPTHGAMQPSEISEFFVRFLTEPGDLVVDDFGGTARAGLAAERNGRRWMVTEWILQYLRGAAELFRDFNGFWMHPALDAVGSR